MGFMHHLTVLPLTRAGMIAKAPPYPLVKTPLTRESVDRKLEMSGRGCGNRRVPLASPISNGEEPEQVNDFANIATAI
ncbi:hypothetical protein PIB30_073944 [Stylosanthes scabra]|uniref:Uncharacterized protein n=1 Tax=Stylosanthes scabra TaxID=79078 RepID=A0ABU6VPJ2_9FABA|nr:hypothetical protein [Stylosanthes scabra]